jgi:hypothetical protein
VHPAGQQRRRAVRLRQGHAHAAVLQLRVVEHLADGADRAAGQVVRLERFDPRLHRALEHALADHTAEQVAVRAARGADREARVSPHSALPTDGPCGFAARPTAVPEPLVAGGRRKPG